MSALSHDDLVARALGALAPDEAARVDATIQADPAARRAFEEVVAHLALYASLPVSPAAPAFDRIDRRLEAAPSGRRSRLVLMASALVAAGLLVAFVAGTRPARTRGYLPAVEVLAEDVDLSRLNSDSELRFTLRSETGGRARVDQRFEVNLSPRSSLTITARGHFLAEGRLSISASHDPARPFRVEAGAVTIEDVGTSFTIDRSGDTRVLVTVEEGEVRANGIRVKAGLGIAFEGPVPTGPAWPLDAKPTIALERDGAPTKAGEPVTLRLVLKNPTDGWVAIPAPDPVRGPVFVEVTDPAGKATPVRITPEMLTGEARLAGGIPPRGNLALGIRFERTFALPGTYRLRAVYQPLGAVERPVSPDLLLEIH